MLIRARSIQCERRQVSLTMEVGFCRVVPESVSTAILQVQDRQSLSAALQALNLCEARPTLVLVGGASKLSQADLQRVTSLFTNALAPLAEQLGLYVVDGGTDAGVMKMMGQARMRMGAQFPLVGVAPVGVVNLPNQPSSHPDAAALDFNHTHCLLVPGSEWGDESSWIAEVATLLAQGNPSLVVLINGGAITWKDADANVSVGRPVLVIRGSGRTADVLAAALEGKTIPDGPARSLVASGLIQAIDLSESAAVLTEKLRRLLTSPSS